MNILNFVLCFVILFLIPEIIGLLFTSFLKKEENSIFLAFIIGYVFNFAIFQLLVIPMIFYKARFETLVNVYIVIEAIICIISLIVNCKNLKHFINNCKDSFNNIPKITVLIALIFVLSQMFIAFKYTHIDEDDAFYIGTAATTVETNTIFQTDGTTGYKYAQLPKRYILSPFSVYIATISKICNIPPAIIAHTIIPPVLILISYIVYGLIAKEWFKANKKSIYLFLIILSIINMWGNYSLRTNHTFLLFRIWQGKAILANIIIPLVWLLFIKAEKNEFRFIDGLLLCMCIIAGILTTSLGIGMPAIILLTLAFIYSILNKKPSYIFKSAICCIPCLIFGVIYIML